MCYLLLIVLQCQLGQIVSPDCGYRHRSIIVQLSLFVLSPLCQDLSQRCNYLETCLRRVEHAGTDRSKRSKTADGA